MKFIWKNNGKKRTRKKPEIDISERKESLKASKQWLSKKKKRKKKKEKQQITRRVRIEEERCPPSWLHKTSEKCQTHPYTQMQLSRFSHWHHQGSASISIRSPCTTHSSIVARWRRIHKSSDQHCPLVWWLLPLNAPQKKHTKLDNPNNPDEQVHRVSQEEQVEQVSLQIREGTITGMLRFPSHCARPNDEALRPFGRHSAGFPEAF